MPTEMIRGNRRPRLSPRGAARRAPKNVPALRIETIWEDCAGDTFGMPSVGSMYPVEN
jgi:hypothetical protein